MFKSEISTGRLGGAFTVVAALVLMAPLAPSAMAQAGGGGGSSGSSGGGAASSGAAGSGSATSGSSTVSPSAGGLVGRSTGDAVPAAPRAFPTTPQTGLGAQQVPSAGNAEPTSPVNRQQAPLGQQTPPLGHATAPPAGSTSPGTATPDSSLDAGAGAGSASEGTSTGTEGVQTTPDGSVGSTETPAPLTGRPPGQPVAPQSPSPSELSGGGTPRTDNSRQGAAGRTLEACMAVWEPATHMTKDQWRETCERTLTQGPELNR